MRKFGWKETVSDRAIAMLGDSATIIKPRRVSNAIANNEADNQILACAIESAADDLVTGDRRHLLPLGEHRGTRIVNAPRFLSALGV